MKQKLIISNGKEFELDISESICKYPNIEKEFFMICDGITIMLTDSIRKQLSEELNIELSEVDRFYVKDKSLIRVNKVTKSRIELYLYDNENNNDFLKKNERTVLYTYEKKYGEKEFDSHIKLLAGVISFPPAWMELYLQSKENITVEFDDNDVIIDDRIFLKEINKKIKEDNECYKNDKLKELFNIQEGI